MRSLYIRFCFSAIMLSCSTAYSMAPPNQKNSVPGEDAVEELVGQQEQLSAATHEHIRYARYPEAASTAKQLIAVMSRLSDPTAHDVARMTRFAEAIQNLRSQSEDVRLRVTKAFIHSNNAVDARERGNVQEATMSALEGYRELTHISGIDPTIVDVTRVELLEHLYSLCIYDVCESIVDESLSYREKAFGTNSWPYADALTMKALAVARGKRDWEQAAALVRRAIAIRRPSGLTAKQYIRELIHLAEFDGRAGRHEEATGLLMLANRLSGKEPLPEFLVAIVSYTMAESEAAYADYKRARELLETANKASRKAKNEDITIDILETTVGVLERLGDKPAAEQRRQEADTIRRKRDEVRSAIKHHVVQQLGTAKR